MSAGAESHFSTNPTQAEPVIEFEPIDQELTSLDLNIVNQEQNLASSYATEMCSIAELKTAILIEEFQNLNTSFRSQIIELVDTNLIDKFNAVRKEKLIKIVSDIENEQTPPTSPRLQTSALPAWPSLDEKSRSQMRKIDLGLELMPNVYSSYFKIMRLTAVNTILAFIDTHFQLNAKIFDNHGTVLRNYSNILPGVEVTEFNMLSFDSKFVYYVQLKEPCSNILIQDRRVKATAHGGSSSRFLIMLDQDLVYVNHVSVSSSVVKLAANSTYLFSLDNSNRLALYDATLQVRCSNFKFDVQPIVRVMDATDDFLLFLHVESKQLRVVSIEFGRCVEVVPCAATQLAVVANDRLILMTERMGLIQSYQLDDTESNPFSLSSPHKVTEVFASSMEVTADTSLTRDKSGLVSFFNRNYFSFF
jgi:hypothetical protein